MLKMNIEHPPFYDTSAFFYFISGVGSPIRLNIRLTQSYSLLIIYINNIISQVLNLIMDPTTTETSSINVLYN